MARNAHSQHRMRVARVVRSRIENGGERLWRMQDFRDLPFAPVAKALSRLARARSIERLSKGIYYRGRLTVFGRSRPNPSDIQRLAEKSRTIHPAGASAAHMLGFTTQSPALVELSTSANSLPRKLIGAQTVVRTRRPSAWIALTVKDAACLEFLRDAGATSELSPQETIRRMLQLLRADKRFDRLAQIAATEPPRVRALIGALGERMRARSHALTALRSTLNPLSRFAFGVFAALPNARAWQAKERET